MLVLLVDEDQTMHHSILDFDSSQTPKRYFDRYSSPKPSFLNPPPLSIILDYFRSAWHLASPFHDAPIADYNVIPRQYPSPSVNQQNTANIKPINVDIIKFEYHPLSQTMVIALKNGILFFDLRRNQWSSNSLSNENQIEI